MVVTSSGEIQEVETLSYDRKSELKAFDDSKAGVKGLVDAGVTKIPRIFVRDQVKLDERSGSGDSKYSTSFPVLDFKGIDEDPALHGEIVDRVRDAFEKWGFFQVLNHGIPVSIMDEMIQGIRRFHEQDTEVKKRFYLRDLTGRFAYFSNHDLYQAPAACWRDTFRFAMAPHPPDPEELPPVCRKIAIEYSRYVMKLAVTLFELVSEALGLKCNHLKDMDCMEGLLLVAHYYPACPAPELTMGTSKHTDVGFLTILLQDQIGGLQVLHENQWVDVPYLPGALVINVGDLLQLITNDKFKSASHRVLANNTGPRISTASFFRPDFQEGSETRLYGPIKELLSEENPPIYKETSVNEYLASWNTKDLVGISPLSPYKLIP